ncbi:MAG: hypothetical protein JAZ02_18095 [Candidatus Thiodiazotropha endolucinida]|nr:hypothetical protein [Candidatus Thiodiazotropha endolucinida]
MRLKKRHSALLVVHLESPNLSPRAPKEVPLGCALIGAFSGTTGPIGLVLTGPRMVQLVEDIKNRYPNRMVIFDMPPVLLSDDVIAFSPYIDVVMLVIEEGVTRKDDLKRAFDLLGEDNLLGTVLNKSKGNELTYGSYY